MASPSFGLILEGTYDAPVYRELVRKLTTPEALVIERVCGGVSQLLRRFPGLLRDLEHVLAGQPVEKAVVIRDSGNKNPGALEAEMAEKIQRHSFSFRRGVQLCVVRREMETWLLADANAISSIAQSRGGRLIPETQGTLEEILNPKQRLVEVLSRAGLSYSPNVCGEIARETSLNMLRYRCPSFISFERKVLDC